MELQELQVPKTAVFSSDLRVLVISSTPDVHCVLYHQTLGNSSWFPQNYNGICIRSMLAAKTNLSRFLKVNVMNWSILSLTWHQ
jgi:hypothetical protein